MVIGTWPVENIVGYLWMTLFILVFYEHFLDDENHPRLSKKHARLFFSSLVVLAAVFGLYYTNPEIVKFAYFYLVAGVAAVAFPVAFAFQNPKIIGKFTSLAFFFFFVWLILEIIGTKNQNWLFPPTGNFVGFVSLFGLSFPFEEVFFWFLWYPAVIVSYYEYFIDDQQ